MDWTDFVAKVEVDVEGFDLIIMRYPSNVAHVAQQVQERWCNSWIADTLLYLSLDTSASRDPDVETELISCQSGDSDFERVISLAFKDYANHYSSNSYLKQLNVADAYSDWARSLANDALSQTFLLRARHGSTLAVAALDISNLLHNEWNLAGVHPDYQRRGIQTQMIRHLARLTREQGKREFITSTQASNIASMRAFTKEGFLPIIAINTLHIMPRIQQRSERPDGAT